MEEDIFNLFMNAPGERHVKLGPCMLRLPAGTQTDHFSGVPDGRPVTDRFGSMLPYVSDRVRAAFF